MFFDGDLLPDLAETVILWRLGVVGSDDLPMIAARWLAAGVVDTDAVRELAEHDPHDPWGLDALVVSALAEANVVVPADTASCTKVVTTWVTGRWRRDGDTQGAVRLLARVGEASDGLDLDQFVLLEDAWSAGWGGSASDIEADAERELRALGQPDL